MSHGGAARKHRAGAISAVLVCLKSAEPFYEPSVLTPARSNNRCGFERSASGAGRTLRYAGGSAPARRPTQNDVPLTLLNWRKTDICILRGHDSAPAKAQKHKMLISAETRAFDGARCPIRLPRRRGARSWTVRGPLR